MNESNWYTWYGVLILSKWPCKFFERPYSHSKMGRSLLVCETVINNQPVVVATSHFESLDNPKVRASQMQEAFKVLSKYPNSFLMGDFNFDSSWTNEQAAIDPAYSDIYLDLNGGKEGFTMAATPYFPQCRLDKILAHKSSAWRPQSIKVVGNFSIPSFKAEDPAAIAGDGKVRTPSDHLGLYSTFNFTQ